MASKKTQKLQLSEQEAMGKKTVGRKRKGNSKKDALMLTDTEDEDVPLAQAFSSIKKKKKTKGTSKDQAIDAVQDKEVAEEPKEDQVMEEPAKKTSTPKRKKQKARRNLEIIEPTVLNKILTSTAFLFLEPSAFSGSEAFSTGSGSCSASTMSRSLLAFCFLLFLLN